MKRKLQLIALTFMATFLITNLGFAQFVAQKLENPVSTVSAEKEGEWIHYDSGESDNALGLNEAGLFESAIRWEPADLAEYDGMSITKIKVYISNLPTSAAVKIYQGVDGTSLDQMYVQSYEPVADSWNEVILDSPIPIDASLELWISSEVGDPGAGQFPSGMDSTIDAIGFGNMVNLGDGWDILTDLADIPGVFALQAFVEGESNTVVDIIVGSEDHTTLATAVTAAGLVDALSGEGPFTVFAPTNAAFDALPDGLLDALLADPEGDLTKVLLYHVVAGDVMSGDLSDGQVITTLLGQDLTVSIDGEDVFIVDSEGNQAQVTVPDLEADNGVVHVVDGVLIPDLTVATYNVTFNVDMTDAVAVGDVAFDPEIHSVFLTGTFTEWATPGDEGSVELELVVDTKEDPVIIWEEGFEPADATGALPDGWTQKKADNAIGDNLQDLAEGDTQWWRYSEQYDMGYSEFFPEWIRTGEASMHINWNVEAEQNVYAISPVFVLPEADMMMLEFWKYFPASYETEINVLLELDGTWEVLGEYNSFETENLYSSAVEIDLTGKVGTARIAFAYKWTDGIQMNIDDVKVYGTIGGETGNIYTTTLDIEEGEQEYKYFLVEDAPTWDLGEAEGTNNRVVDITDDVVLNDIWGDFGTFVDNVLFEDGLNLFPNPVSNTLYVENSELINELRIYDLTGRLVFSQVVNDNNTSVNVSMFKTGVYIMQVMTDNGVASKKFNVK
ncbi:MAG: fasciclin domain-containing protein [Bacteroidales bacterium]